MLEFWDGVDQNGNIYKKIAYDQRMGIDNALKSVAKTHAEREYLVRGPKTTRVMEMNKLDKPKWPWQYVRITWFYPQ
jgi:hypothetical protein